MHNYILGTATLCVAMVSPSHHANRPGFPFLYDYHYHAPDSLQMYRLPLIVFLSVLQSRESRAFTAWHVMLSPQRLDTEDLLFLVEYTCTCSY